MEKEKEEGYTGENTSLFEINKVTVIPQMGFDDEPYMVRRTLFSFWKFFSIKIHDILASDSLCLHDHPWGFITFLLKGGYYEWTYLDFYLKKHQNQNEVIKTAIELKENKKIIDWSMDDDGMIIVKKWYGPGRILYRPARYIHRLELMEGRGESMYAHEIGPVPCKSFVITGPEIRPWGFFTKGGWMFWKYYNAFRHC